MAFYVNKKGADTATEHDIEATKLDYKALKAFRDDAEPEDADEDLSFTLFTKPVRRHEISNHRFRELFPSACFNMLRMTKLKPKPKSSEVKAGEFDSYIAVTPLAGSSKVSVWEVLITEDMVSIIPQA